MFNLEGCDKFMLSEKKWILNLKFILDIFSSIAMVVIVFFSWQVYENQLKVMENQNSPKFKISVSTEPIDNSYERYIQVNNLGEPVKANIDTHAIMTLQLHDGDKIKHIDILLDGYFDKTDDIIKNGTSMTDVLCRRGTNFCDEYINTEVINTRLKINELFNSREILIYVNLRYLVKIEYKNYKDKDVNKYYLVGNFENKMISENDFKDLMNTKYRLDIEDYLNSSVNDKFIKILLENLN